MKKNKMFSSIALGLMALLLLVGCSIGGDNAAEDSSSSTGTNSGDMQIEVIAKGFTQQFWTSVQEGAQQAADELGVTMNFVGPSNETAIQEQVQMLSNAINKKPNAIALASLDTNSQIDLLQQASTQEIPIIGFDSGVPDAPEGSVAATVATNNHEAAGMAAEKIFEALETQLSEASVEVPVRIGLLSQEANSKSINDRTQGFIDKFIELADSRDNLADKVAVLGHEKFSNDLSEDQSAVLIDVQIPSQASDTEAQITAQALLNKGDLIGVFASNEMMAKGLINANESLGGVLGIDGIVAAGFDSGKLQKNAIANDTFIGAVTQDPIKMGYDTVTTTVAAANGEPVEDVDVPTVWYNSDNIDSDEISPLLYE